MALLTSIVEILQVIRLEVRRQINEVRWAFGSTQFRCLRRLNIRCDGAGEECRAVRSSEHMVEKGGSTGKAELDFSQHHDRERAAKSSQVYALTGYERGRSDEASEM